MMKHTLKTIRILRDMTTSEVAGKLGIARSTIISWEERKTYPTIKQAFELCRLYNVTIDDIEF